MKSETDRILVLQLKTYSIKLHKYSHKLYRFALLNTRENSRKIIQNALCRIWDKRHKLFSSKSSKSFLFTISYILIILQLLLRLKKQKGLAKYSVWEFPTKRQQVYLLNREESLSQKEIETNRWMIIFH